MRFKNRKKKKGKRRNFERVERVEDLHKGLCIIPNAREPVASYLSSRMKLIVARGELSEDQHQEENSGAATRQP